MLGRMIKRRGRLDDVQTEALRAVLTDPIFELLPLKSIGDQVAHLPAGARVSVTASPNKGIDATVDWAIRLQADGFRAIPHLSARMIASRDVLVQLLDRARAGGLSQAFVVGGDADEPGEYLDGLSLLRAMTELGHPFATIGCPGYPQGHPDIPDSALADALRDKAPYVAHVTTQMDFDTGAIERWVRARRADGFAPDVVVGVPGVADPQKLLSIAARIGVKDAKRFVVKNLRFVTGLARSGGFYKPTGFVQDLAPLLADRSARVIGLHLYTFNSVEATEAWRRSMLEKLG
ncbi:MAG: methylenetetrahydrofolate reductase [Chloroflexota bacterium]|jgi:methylenetetrahydrofolate reductase (NADPH)|nr:methylenetetrahydrofolate reductase [Chloroflexota bacterium]